MSRRHQASRPGEKEFIHSSGGAQCTASRSASYQTGDKRGAAEKGPIRVPEFPGSKFRKRFALALAEPRGPPARGSCFPAVAVDFPAKGHSSANSFEFSLYLWQGDSASERCAESSELGAWQPLIGVLELILDNMAPLPSPARPDRQSGCGCGIAIP